MAFPISPSDGQFQFVTEDPTRYSDDETETDSDSESSGDEEDELSAFASAVSVSELLDEVLDRMIRGGNLNHYRDFEQIERDGTLVGNHLAEDTGITENPTALHILASSKRDDLPTSKLRPLVEFLVQHPRNLLAQADKAGYTPLHTAIEEKKKDLVEMMCQVHPKIDSILSIQSHLRKNCLHVGIEKEVEFLPFLIEKAEPQTLCAKDNNGNTPLHLAVKYDHCKSDQIKTVQAIVAKCDRIMKESEEICYTDEASILTYNNNQLSPYLYHIESCTTAEAEKKRRREARKAKAEKSVKDRRKTAATRADGPSGKDDRARRRIAPPETPSAPPDTRREPSPEPKPPSRSNTGFMEQGGRDAGTIQIDERRVSTLGYGERDGNTRNHNTSSHHDASRYYNTKSPALRVAEVQTQEAETGNTYHEWNLARFSKASTDSRSESANRKDTSRVRPEHKRSERHNSEKGHSAKPSKESIQEIRLFLKQHYLRERSHDAALDILYGRNTTSDQQIYFDLSGYSTLTRRRLQKGLKNVKFDDTLQYVDVPRITIEGTEAIANTSKLRGMTTRADPSGNGRTDLVFIFSWLRSKGVETILQVIVDDLGQQAHGDEAIEEATKDFGIEVWNWKKTDLCAEVIVTAAPGAKVVHLYWTGNNAVLRGWCDVGGLKKLQHLRALYIHVQQGLDSHARTKANMSYFESHMKAARHDLAINWDGLQVPRNSPAAADSKTPVDRHVQPSQHDWIKCMTDFKRLLNEAEANFARTESTKIEDEIEDSIKVALIDDGININELEYTPIGGRSFCPRNEDKSHNFPYYVSSSGHGTIMASQIYRICPRAQLYVLKLEDYADANGNRQITARSAAQAIRAAVGRGVHIISMSWTLEPPPDERARADLESAVAEAAARKILMFCSASDGGAREDLSYPFAAAPRRIFRIGGAYASGATDADVGSTSRIDFTFPGNNVEVASSLAGGAFSSAAGGGKGAGKRGGGGGGGAGGGGTGGIEDNTKFKYRTGSSVATALAAGLAALILYCVQVRLLRARKDEAEAVRAQFRRLTEHDQMMKAFRSIGVTEESNYKYIAVWDTFEKPVRKSKDVPKDRWVDLVAGVGAELCMKISA
ncbi:hypothetical protein F5Y19DRAFT_462121 [Xylariaceae sp. FL1651]|nr:hypothetical protein F5Y19DRAFT_462121 [Xylariaceae sp. FL1651]